jgi:hypothetical protein
MAVTKWAVYRVKYLVRATQLTGPCSVLVDGETEIGEAGDYLVHYSDGTRRIVRRQVFEGLYSQLEFQAG